MSSIELRAQLFNELNSILDNDSLIEKLLNYIKRVKKVAKTGKNSTAITSNDFYAIVEEGEEAYRQGKCHTMRQEEDLTAFLKRNGHDLLLSAYGHYDDK